MKQTSEHGENVKNHMQIRFFDTRLAEKSADCIKNTARNKKSETPVIEPARYGKGAREHTRPAGEIHRHYQSLEFFKKEKFGAYSEQRAEPRGAENNIIVQRVNSA